MSKFSLKQIYIFKYLRFHILKLYTYITYNILMVVNKYASNATKIGLLNEYFNPFHYFFTSLFCPLIFKLFLFENISQIYRNLIFLKLLGLLCIHFNLLFKLCMRSFILIYTTDSMNEWYVC